MAVMVQSEVSFVVSTVGLVIPFIVTDRGTGLPISNALSATVTWINQAGQRRPLLLESPISAVFTYTVSAHEFRAPRREVGRLYVSYTGGTGFWSVSSFTVAVNAAF